MKDANKMLTTSSKNTDLDANSIGGIEQQQEKQSVYQDLLKGVVTEEVRQLRHEMYYSEREAKNYKYSGGGMAKKNTMFDYKGDVDRSDGNRIIIVQENQQITASMGDTGVLVYGENVDVSDNIETLIRNKPRSEKEYRIKIDREGYIPKFKIENYVKKVVVKNVEESEKPLVLIDLYISKYVDKFEKTSKLFHVEMEKIYQGLDLGNYRGGILDFKRLYFTSKDAYGLPDYIKISFTNFNFETILEYSGCYVLRFTATEENKDDLIEVAYHKPTAEKCKKHEMREGATVNFEDLVGADTADKYNTEEAMILINAMGDKNNSED